MFTGLIREVGQVAGLARHGDKTRLSVSGRSLVPQLKIGDSIAVSGVCLTVVDLVPSDDSAQHVFCADLAEETVQRTSLRQLRQGARVNLELPARAEERLDGHVVQGHVDGVATLVSLAQIPGGEDWRLTFGVPPDLMRYVVPQGSVTVEGISLTVARIDGDQVEIAIIPHTYQETNLSSLQPEAPLNIEVDVLAKYAEKLAAKKPSKQFSVEEFVGKGF